MTITTSPFFELERCLATWLDNSWSREQHLAHCAQGLVAEVGELIGSIDKAEFKSAEHGLRDRVAAEIGDILYYVVIARHLCGHPTALPELRAILLVLPRRLPPTLAQMAKASAMVAEGILEGSAGELLLERLQQQVLCIARYYAIPNEEIEAVNAGKLSNGHGWGGAAS